MTASIEVLELRRIEGHDNLRAFAKIKLGCVLIHGVRVIQQPNQRPWCALPRQPARKKADGAGAGWFPVFEITNRDVLDRLRAAVLEAWAAHQSRDLPTRGGRQSHEPVEERAAAWSKRQRDEHAQELADRFEPDEEPPF
jgi:DNA-binding cell septation regulator SpoVG